MSLCVLALDCALGPCGAGVFEDGVALAELSEARERGQAARLPTMAAEVLAQAGREIGLVAVCVGPGSFTGLRAAIALAQGLADGWECKIVGVGAAEAFGEWVGDGGAPVWVALHSRPGRVFLARDAEVASFGLMALPLPEGAPVLTGNAAEAVGAALGMGRFGAVRPLAAPPLAAIAAVAVRRHAGLLPELAAQPLYVDAPEARPAAA